METWLVLFLVGLVFSISGVLGFVVYPAVFPIGQRWQRLLLTGIGLGLLLFGAIEFRESRSARPIPMAGVTPTSVATRTATPTSMVTPMPSPSPGAKSVVLVGKLPFSVEGNYAPSGWMGDSRDITLNDAHTINCHSAPTCIGISYTAARTQGYGWTGIYWVHPEGNLGSMDGGFDLSRAVRLSFWARGENGGEVVEFKAGGLGDATTKYRDTLWPAKSTRPIVLTRQWTQYHIDVSGEDLRRIMGGFVWVSSAVANPKGVVFYLDDIAYE